MFGTAAASNAGPDRRGRATQIAIQQYTDNIAKTKCIVGHDVFTCANMQTLQRDTFVRALTAFTRRFDALGSGLRPPAPICLFAVCLYFYTHAYLPAQEADIEVCTRTNTLTHK